MAKLASSATLLALALALPAHTAPLMVEAARGNGVQSYGVATNVFARADIYPARDWQLDRAWTARAMYWNAEHPKPYGKHLWDASLVPTLRLSERQFELVQPFIEVGVGAHLLSATAIDHRPLSTAFQFCEQAALGVR